MMKKFVSEKKCTAALLVCIIGMTLVAGCASGGSSKEASEPAAAAEEASEPAAAAEEASEPATAAEEASEPAAAAGEASKPATVEKAPISKEDLKAATESAKPYGGEMQVVLRTSSGKEIVLYSPDDNKEAVEKFSAMSNSSPHWISVESAGASTTLQIDGYSYSVLNMLDWDTTTCWAEGESRSEGLYENFNYWFFDTTRIDGFRIYPGYQKNQKVYRNNIYPAAFIVTAGGYSIDCDLGDWPRDLYYDGDNYWIDVTFSEPVYDNSMNVMIIAVGTYGEDPDPDCCITEFHPFYY